MFMINRKSHCKTLPVNKLIDLTVSNERPLSDLLKHELFKISKKG